MHPPSPTSSSSNTHLHPPSHALFSPPRTHTCTFIAQLHLASRAHTFAPNITHISCHLSSRTCTQHLTHQTHLHSEKHLQTQTHLYSEKHTCNPKNTPAFRKTHTYAQSHTHLHLHRTLSCTAVSCSRNPASYRPARTHHQTQTCTYIPTIITHRLSCI
jgi:hypothetical protein